MDKVKYSEKVRPAFIRIKHRLNCDKAVCEQSWWMVSVGRCSCTHIKGHNQLVEVQHWTLHSAGRLASKFARFVSDWKCLEHYDCSCLCQPRAADTDGTRTSSLEILEIKFFDTCASSHRFDAWQTEGNHQKQRRHCSVLILSLCTVVN